MILPSKPLRPPSCLSCSVMCSQMGTPFVLSPHSPLHPHPTTWRSSCGVSRTCGGGGGSRMTGSGVARGQGHD